MNIILKQKGFTLIEIVTIIVVLAILGMFTFSFIDYATKTYAMGSKQRMVYQEASYIMERVTRELRDMIDPATWSNGTTYNTLQFNKTHSALDGSTNVTFRRDTATNIMYRDGGTSQPVGSNITQFKIVRISSASTCSRSIDITLTLQNGDQSITVNSRVTPKNLGSSNYTDRCFNGDYEDIIQ